MVITSSMAAVKPFDAVRKQPWTEEDWNSLTEEQLEKNTYLYIKVCTPIVHMGLLNLKYLASLQRLREEHENCNLYADADREEVLRAG